MNTVFATPIPPLIVSCEPVKEGHDQWPGQGPYHRLAAVGASIGVEGWVCKVHKQDEKASQIQCRLEAGPQLPSRVCSSILWVGSICVSPCWHYGLANLKNLLLLRFFWCVLLRHFLVRYPTVSCDRSFPFPNSPVCVCVTRPEPASRLSQWFFTFPLCDTELAGDPQRDLADVQGMRKPFRVCGHWHWDDWLSWCFFLWLIHPITILLILSDW